MSAETSTYTASGDSSWSRTDSVAGESATVHHPFWVLSGRELDQRSVPRELDPQEDQGRALAGRWVDSHELRCGDTLVGRDGERRTVLWLEQSYASGQPVFNLTVEADHTYAVGPDAVLVHNTASCETFGNKFTPSADSAKAPTTNARGGTYKLRDADGNVQRTGRTNDLGRR